MSFKTIKSLVLKKRNEIHDINQSLGLSKRESEVVYFLFCGMTNRDMGKKMIVTEKTIKFHLSNIYKRLNVSNRLNLLLDYPCDNLMKEKISIGNSLPTGKV